MSELNEQIRAEMAAHILNEVSNVGDFTKTQQMQPKRGQSQESLNSLAMYKMLMTLSNFHDAVSDLYNAQGGNQKGKYHSDLSSKLRAEASTFRKSI